MPRSILFSSLAVTALVVVGLTLHALRKPEPHQRQKNEAVKLASALYPALGNEVPVSGMATAGTMASDGFTYPVCTVEIYDGGSVLLATFTMDMFSRELVRVTCPTYPPTTDRLTKAQAYWVACDYARNLGMKVPGYPWKMAKVEVSVQSPRVARFCWVLDRCVLRVSVDMSNSRLVCAQTFKLSQHGYIPR